jgi:hypothetical protein
MTAWPAMAEAKKDGSIVVLAKFLTKATYKEAAKQEVAYGYWDGSQWVRVNGEPFDKPDCWRHITKEEKAELRKGNHGLSD